MRQSRFLAAGLFLVGAVAVMEAQQPRQGGFGRGLGFDVISMVTSNADLQSELKVTDAQKDKLKAIADKEAETRKKAFEGGKGGKGGFDKDRFAEFQKAREENRKAIEGILTADQKKRAKEIQLQVDGIRAFADDEVAAQLNLNETQKNKIKGIGEDYRKDVGELFGRGGDREKAAENAKKREKLSKAAMADIEDVLTDEQRSKWKTMVGAPFDTTKLRTAGFGGRGGFGGGKGKGRTKD
jgi:Spy/CpxP family protein refolding chaperone